MFGRRRPVLFLLLLAFSIIILQGSGDGPGVGRMFDLKRPEKAGAFEQEITSVRTEKLILEGTSWETPYYIIASPEQGPTVMIISGIHGDEPAGYLAADSIATWAIDRGTLVVIPRANVPAIADRKRNAPGGPDLNRSFPGDPLGDQTAVLADALFTLLEEFAPDWVIDLHEAEVCERKVRGALGQSFIYPHDAVSLDIVEELLTAVNRTIIDEEYHFILLRGMAGGSALEAAHLTGAEALIIETCMQMSIEDRIKYHRQVIASLLYLLGITVY